jgi:hypothetical protein
MHEEPVAARAGRVPMHAARDSGERSTSRTLAREGAFLLAILAIGWNVRTASWPGVRTTDGWRFADGDSYYHLHRIEASVRRHGRVPMFDPRLGYPDGERLQWHAGYDLPMAALVAVRCGRTPTRGCLEETAAWSTPALGTATVLLVYALARTLVSPWCALGAAFLFAAYPFAAGSALLGHVDHHVLEPTCVAAWFLLLAQRRYALAGATAGLSLAVFPTALLPIAATLGALAMDRAWRLARDAERDDRPARFALATAITSVPVAWTGAFPDRVEPAATSLFHVAALGAAASACVAVEWLAARPALASRDRQARALLLWIACGVLLAWILRDALGRLALFSRAEGLWTGVVQQQPLATGFAAQSVLVAIALFASAITVVHGSTRASLPLRALGLAAFPLAVTGLAQIRFLMAASPLLTIALALAWTQAHAWLLRHTSVAPPRARRLARLVSITFALVLLAPLREYLNRDPGPRRFADGIRVLERLAAGRHGPPANASILSDWKWGHHIRYFTPFAAVAHPFMLSGADRALVETRAALLAEAPEALLSVMQARRSTYLMVESPFRVESVARSVRRTPPKRPVARALLGSEIAGWEALRLADAAGAVRLFERVAGARIVGHASPGSRVEAVLRLSPVDAAPVTRRFHAAAGGSGAFEIRVPEWTARSADSVRSDAVFAVGRCRARVTEQDVRHDGVVHSECE